MYLKKMKVTPLTLTSELPILPQGETNFLYDTLGL